MANSKYSKYFKKDAGSVAKKLKLIGNKCCNDESVIIKQNCENLSSEGPLENSEESLHKPGFLPNTYSNQTEDKLLKTNFSSIFTDLTEKVDLNELDKFSDEEKCVELKLGLENCSAVSRLNEEKSSEISQDTNYGTVLMLNDKMGLIEKVDASNDDVITLLNETKNEKFKLSLPSILKRRPGKIYQLKLAEKIKGRKSHYFRNRKLEQHRWLPPRSPYSLIQEDLYHSPWQLLIATIFLTKTQAKKAIPQILKFLERWPTPQGLLAAKQEDIIEYLKPLGIQHVRSSIIRKFSAEFLEKDWTYPEELHGIGKYGNDSYRIFCVNEWRLVYPNDNKLNLYKNWLTENAERLGI